VDNGKQSLYDRSVLIKPTGVLLIAASLAAFAQEAPKKPSSKKAGAVSQWVPPRTAWGNPDLQGVWNNSTITELERPRDLSGKQVLADDEAATVERRAAQNRVDGQPPAGDPGTYNQFWFDRGTKVVPTKRTALIVDPQDGKLPPLTPAGQKRQEERFRRLGPTALGSSGTARSTPMRTSAWSPAASRAGSPTLCFPAGTTTTIKFCKCPEWWCCCPK
jgi:hypothetical protein